MLQIYITGYNTLFLFVLTAVVYGVVCSDPDVRGSRIPDHRLSRFPEGLLTVFLSSVQLRMHKFRIVWIFTKPFVDACTELQRGQCIVTSHI